MIPLTIALIALAVIYVVGCFLVELEWFGWATVILIATVVGVQTLQVFDILHYVADNILTSTLYAAGYIVVGVVWSFVKWFSYLMRYRDKFRELKQSFLVKHNVNDNVMPAEHKEAFENYMRNQWQKPEYSGLKHGLKPVAAENKAKITAWMAFWPCSLISTLLNDPVRRLFRFLFNTFKVLYQKMADAVLKLRVLPHSKGRAIFGSFYGMKFS